MKLINYLKKLFKNWSKNSNNLGKYMKASGLFFVCRITEGQFSHLLPYPFHKITGHYGIFFDYDNKTYLNVLTTTPTNNPYIRTLFFTQKTITGKHDVPQLIVDQTYLPGPIGKIWGREPTQLADMWGKANFERIQHFLTLKKKVWMLSHIDAIDVFGLIQDNATNLPGI